MEGPQFSNGKGSWGGKLGKRLRSVELCVPILLLLPYIRLVSEKDVHVCAICL